VNSRTRRPKKIKKTKQGVSAVAIAAAVISCCLAVFFITKSKNVDSKESNKQVRKSVVLASEDDVVLVPTPLRSIAKGEKIGSVTFVRTKWPRSKLTMRYVENVDSVSDSVALVALPASLPVPITAISKNASVGNEVVDRIPPEMRAITVRVDAESAVEGWARPGDFVDVILLMNSKSKDRGGIEAKVIAENVKILSAGRSTQPLGGKESASRAPATVTLLVDQENALKVKAANKMGKLTFALRGTGDLTPTLAKRIDQKSILGRARPYVKKKNLYKAKAKGPDGRTYLLSENSQWVEAKKTLAKETPEVKIASEEGSENKQSEEK